MTRSRQLARDVIADGKSALDLMRQPVLLLWAIYILATPLYIWRSGLPQPGDYLVILIAPMALSAWNGRFSGPVVRTIRALGWFTVYVIVSNVVWTLILQAYSLSLKHGFGLSPVFYIFNALVFIVVLALHQVHRRKLLHLTTTIVLASLVLQVLIASVLGGGGRRATVLFNNPNQLGYYALLCASMLVLLQRRGFANTLHVAIGTLCGTYLGLISASKAALAGIVLLGVAGLVTRLRTAMVIVVALFALLVLPSPMRDALERAMNRIATDESHGFVEERGYDRIENHPEYWLLGSGEGAYQRFKDTTTIGAHEIHSSIGTLFFCYGIVGTLMFAAFLWRVLRGSGLATWLLVTPSLAYGMTHQGLRFTMFWVLLALIVALKTERGPPKPAAAR
ncbi:MAG: hypothetical protein AB7O24_20715 [Kofleriaceae bacterium]